MNNFKNIIDENKILVGELMKNHTTFHIGGEVDLMLLPETEEEIIEIIRMCNKIGRNFFVLGGGSNLLVPDTGLKDIVIKLSKNYSDFQIEKNIVVAESGIKLSSLSDRITEANLTGFEFASGIPGTVGGGVYMNAGAYDSEMKNIVKSVRVIDQKGQVREYTNEQMKFAYRTSFAMEEKSVISKVVFELQEGNQEDIINKIKDFSNRRAEKQPITEYSAGSTFKRPVGHYAGKLIEEAGLKGFSLGNAKVSEKHSGFIINKGGCSYQEMVDFIDEVKDRVYKNSGIRLEEEVRIFGRNI